MHVVPAPKHRYALPKLQLVDQRLQLIAVWSLADYDKFCGRKLNQNVSCGMQEDVDSLLNRQSSDQANDRRMVFEYGIRWRWGGVVKGSQVNSISNQMNFIFANAGPYQTQVTLVRDSKTS